MVKKKAITLEDLAGMVQRGFIEVHERFDAVDKRFDNLEAEVVLLRREVTLIRKELADLRFKYNELVPRSEFLKVVQRLDRLEVQFAALTK